MHAEPLEYVGGAPSEEKTQVIRVRKTPRRPEKLITDKPEEQEWFEDKPKDDVMAYAEARARKRTEAAEKKTAKMKERRATEREEEETGIRLGKLKKLAAEETKRAAAEARTRIAEEKVKQMKTRRAVEATEEDNAIEEARMRAKKAVETAEKPPAPPPAQPKQKKGFFGWLNMLFK